MGNKRLIISFLVLLVFFIGRYFITPDIVKTKHVGVESPNSQLKEVAKVDEEYNEVVALKKPPKQLVNSPVEILDDAVETIYDEDPVVNASMLLKENVLCIRHLSNSRNNALYLQRFKARLDENQQKFYENYSQYCYDLDKKHPEYHLTDKKILTQQKNNAQAISKWGRIIKGELVVGDLSDADIRELLQSNDVNILSQAPKYLRDYYQKVIHWDLESVLQNHQYDYVEYIKNYAHQLYLCQLGSDCTANSSTMVMLCYLNSKGCGLSYENYVQDILTQGQQADIALAIEFLKSQYN